MSEAPFGLELNGAFVAQGSGRAVVIKKYTYAPEHHGRGPEITPCFSTYFIRDCRYAMSCVILLLMKDMAPLVQLLSAAPTLTDEALSFILFYSFVQYVL